MAALRRPYRRLRRRSFRGLWRWPLWRGRRRAFPLTQGLASLAASGGLRAARFFLAEQLGRRPLRVNRATFGLSPAFGGTVGRRACFLEQEGPSRPLQTDQTKEVMMTYSVPRSSALAFGVAALVSLSALSAARADSPSEPAPTPSVTLPAHPPSAPAPAPISSAAAPSLNEPAPTPAWAELGSHRTTVAQNLNGPAYCPPSLRIPYRAPLAIILSRRSRWAWPEAPPIWDRSPLIHSIASRTTAPVRSACPIGIEGRVSLVSKALGGPGRLELQFFKSGTP